MFGCGLQHGRAKDMPGRVQLKFAAEIRGPSLIEVEDGLLPFARHAQPHQAGGGAGGDNLPVRPDVIGVSVGDEAAVPGLARI